MKNAYLTIDDSPSRDTDALIDFLRARDVPALLFVRGAFMEEGAAFARIVRAIEQGFVIGNHSYAHERTSEIGFTAQTEQILKTQDLIDRAYAQAGKEQAIKTIRFPHMDRATGAHVIDFDTVETPYRDYVCKLFWDGLNVDTSRAPSPEQIELKSKMQEWLRAQGFQKFSPADVTHPWFTGSEMAQAVDVMYTYSTSDWMMTPRHAGKALYKTKQALVDKIHADVWLNREDSAHIILAHDDREDSFDITTSLIDQFIARGFKFKPII